MKKRHQKTNKKAPNLVKKENKILLALLLIIVFLFALKILTQQEDFQENKLKEDAEKVLNAITTYNLKDVGYVDEHGIEEIMKSDYNSLKNKLGMENDFCIHFEDQDGNLIKVNGLNAGMGSSKVRINGISCG